MSNYKLSKHITITSLTDNYDTTVPVSFRHNHYSLKDEVRDKEFVINGTVKYFIQKFSTPKSLKNLIKEVEEELKADSSEVKKTCTSFFELLRKKKILIPENKNEDIIEIETFLKKDDFFDGYEIQDILSDRGCIEIYLAFDMSTLQQRVLKLLNAGKTNDEESYDEEVNELENEFSMMKSVDHVGVICKAFDFKKNNKYAYIVLEYIQGISLSRFLRRNPGLTGKECLTIIDGFLSGFSEMHKSGLIHGDIHSSNIMVKDANTVKIIDLGFSRKVEPDGDELVSYGGVTHYMPPERINISNTRKYTRDADLYSDVYQMGILIYMVLYNTLPFDGFTWEELSKNIKHGKVPYPGKTFFSFTDPKALVKIVQKCLSKKPSSRFNNAAEVYKAFAENTQGKEAKA